VDTAVAHLAGALGIPLWVLVPFNPDWRWLLDKEETAWYPSAQLFRQQRWGDWEDVFQRVAQALRKRARRPLPSQVTLLVDLVEAFERAVVEEASGGSQERWARLRRLGLADTKEVRHLALRLKGAHIHLKNVKMEMKILVEDAKVAHGMEQLRRYVKAEKEYADRLRQVSAWLKGEEI
jgi:hypothetical protein